MRGLCGIGENYKIILNKQESGDFVASVGNQADSIEIPNSQAKAEELKRLLKNYDEMSGRTRQALKNLGFEITEEGKHYKITYYGDGRYQTTYSKTPSDGRTGKNSAQQTINIAF